MENVHEGATVLPAKGDSDFMFCLKKLPGTYNR